MTDLMIVGGGAAGLIAAICFLEECPQGKVKLLEAVWVKSCSAPATAAAT